MQVSVPHRDLWLESHVSPASRQVAPSSPVSTAAHSAFLVHTPPVQAMLFQLMHYKAIGPKQGLNQALRNLIHTCRIWLECKA